MGTTDPVWADSIVLHTAYTSSPIQDAMGVQQERARLQPLLMRSLSLLLTCHDEGCTKTDNFLGQVLLSDWKPGTRLERWCPLYTRCGKLQINHMGNISAVKLRLSDNRSTSNSDMLARATTASERIQANLRRLLATRDYCHALAHLASVVTSELPGSGAHHDLSARLCLGSLQRLRAARAVASQRVSGVMRHVGELLVDRSGIELSDMNAELLATQTREGLDQAEALSSLGLDLLNDGHAGLARKYLRRALDRLRPLDARARRTRRFWAVLTRIVLSDCVEDDDMEALLAEAIEVGVAASTKGHGLVPNASPVQRWRAAGALQPRPFSHEVKAQTPADVGVLLGRTLHSPSSGDLQPPFDNMGPAEGLRTLSSRRQIKFRITDWSSGGLGSDPTADPGKSESGQETGQVIQQPGLASPVRTWRHSDAGWTDANVPSGPKPCRKDCIATRAGPLACAHVDYPCVMNRYHAASGELLPGKAPLVTAKRFLADDGTTVGMAHPDEICDFGDSVHHDSVPSHSLDIAKPHELDAMPVNAKNTATARWGGPDQVRKGAKLPVERLIDACRDFRQGHVSAAFVASTPSKPHGAPGHESDSRFLGTKRSELESLDDGDARPEVEVRISDDTNVGTRRVGQFAEQLLRLKLLSATLGNQSAHKTSSPYTDRAKDPWPVCFSRPPLATTQEGSNRGTHPGAIRGMTRFGGAADRHPGDRISYLEAALNLLDTERI